MRYVDTRTAERERERERCRKKNSRKVGESKKFLGRSERHFMLGREKEHYF
jgi:hypothetical protein